MKDQAYLLRKAEENMPTLYTRELRPAQSRFDAVTGDSVLLDLGEHAVGHFSFSFDVQDDFISAPVRLIIKFGEDLREIEDDFSTYHGKLSSVWLQEEPLVLDYPGKVQMPRRYSCRYIKITVDNTRRPITLSDFLFVATTSADVCALRPTATADPLLAEIDRVAAVTLQECMQTFLEDGPKRDRRLWIGDLRLEALTNYYTFNNREVVKRCLYLIGAGDYDALGLLPSYIYETPYFFSGRDHIADYALLYVVSVCDYFEHTQDRETLADLLPICRDQLEAMTRLLDADGIVTQQSGWFTFIDWCRGLRALTALQGVYLYTLDRFATLLESLQDADAPRYRELLKQGRATTRRHLFDKARGVFVNDRDGNQLSVHSQVWMILGGVVAGDEAKHALRQSLSDPTAYRPFTPYMWHYVIDAMLTVGMTKEAVDCIKTFWGGMLARGADTFFEAYVPDDPDFSPYGDRMINSLCHAWSCSPAYFIRKYGL